MSATPFSAAEDGLMVAVRLTPKASRNEVAGLRPAADGRVEIVVKVTAPPERGRANAALLALLSRSWGLPASRIQVVSGAADRHKLLLVEGEPESLRQRFEDWLKGIIE